MKIIHVNCGVKNYKGSEWVIMKVDHRSYRRNFRSCVYNCNDLSSYNSSLRSLKIRFSYIHNLMIIL